MKKLLIYSFTGLLASGVIAGLLHLNRIQNLNAAPGSPRSSSGVPSPQQRMMGQVDRHFIENMIPHHQGAIEMAQLAPSRATHSEIKKLAESIIQDQTREINQMRTWYKAWYGADVPAASSGMVSDRSGGMGMHHGMSMEAELAALKEAPDFDREFIRQMIPHHRMAVQMAQMLSNRTTRPEMQNLAQSMIKSQRSEIAQMQQWNQAWYR